MFDEETISLIKSALPLEGLDLENLPQDLTDAYATVVSARLGAIRFDEQADNDEWRGHLVRLRRLSETYEAITLFLPLDDPQRPACAFVAASAHNTLNQARRVQSRVSGIDDSRPSLSAVAVAPEVAATLLFLLGGHHADSSEAAKSFNFENDSREATRLLKFIAAMAEGRGEELRVVAEERLELPDLLQADYTEAAAEAVWHDLANAVQRLCRLALGLNADDPLEIINGVLKRLSQKSAEVPWAGSTLQITLPMRGPYHLARLLHHTAEVLLESIVTGTDTPAGIDQNSWSQFTSNFARQRPFLWRNHLKAIEEGFLENGISFVLTFPTGAGKTTITELKIAAELIRGRNVVYLAPTRALVEQVANDLSKTVRPIANDVVRGRFLEDFGESAGGKVFVQTPEQCLAYLSYDPEAHQDLGLIVVDECHQLSCDGDPPGEVRTPGKRSVDAMWTLLSLINRSSGADVVLISAMVRNGSSLASWLEGATTRPCKLLDLSWKPTRQIRGAVAYERSVISNLEAKLMQRRRVRAAKSKNPGVSDKSGIEAIPIGLFCHTQVWNDESTYSIFPLLRSAVSLGVGTTWKLSANRNQVAGQLLAGMASAGMRPIVFSQQINWTSSIADEAASILRANNLGRTVLTQHEEDLFRAAAIELGDSSLVERPVEGRIALHHGLLLLQERLAMEAAFRRPDGLVALVATPTVAQGINLPAEAVIIAGDDRWVQDSEESGPESLAVHELLNAAGRAGRAGHFAHGIVVDLPGKVFAIENGEQGFRFDGFEHLSDIFGVSDQCYDIIDPVTKVIDLVAQEGFHSDVANYLVRRIGGMDQTVLRSVLGSAFGNAQAASKETRVEGQIDIITSKLAELEADEKEEDEAVWRDLATDSGTSPFLLAAISRMLPPHEIVASWSFDELLDFQLEVLIHGPGMLFGLADPGSSDLSRIIPRSSIDVQRRTVFVETVETWERRWQRALRDVVPPWLKGIPLNQIGTTLKAHRAKGSKKKCTTKPITLGRRFALNTTSSLGFSTSLICRVIERCLNDDLPDALQSWLKLVPGCVREGFDNPDKLLLFWHLRRESPGLNPRVAVHGIFRDTIEGSLPEWSDVPEVDERRKLIREALELL